MRVPASPVAVGELISPVLRLEWVWYRTPGPEVTLTLSDGHLTGSIASRFRRRVPGRDSPLSPSPVDIADPGPQDMPALMSWLSLLKPMSRLHVRGDHGLPPWLQGPVTDFASAEMPTKVAWRDLEVTASWDIRFEAFADHHVARASVKYDVVHQSVRVAATTEGSAALLAWLNELHPVEELTLEDDGEGELLQRDLTRAGYFPKRRHASRGPLPVTEGAQFGDVRARLTLRGVGWLDLTLWLGDQRLVIPGSYMASPWYDTLHALTSLLQGAETADPIWVKNEPEEYQLHLRRNEDGSVILHVTTDVLADDPPGVTDLEVLTRRRVVNLRDLANAFLSATHALLHATPAQDLARRWPSRNPGRAIGALERALATSSNGSPTAAGPAAAKGIR